VSLYLDTSTIVPLFVAEDYSNEIAAWLEAAEQVLIVADLAVAEFNAVVSRLVRSRAIDQASADSIRSQFAEWRDAAAESLENLPADIREAGKLVCTPRPKLLTADATHLATCKRLRITLVTLDADLQAIAEREGVPWAHPGRVPQSLKSPP